ncbi:MAG: FAD-dependent oxidoreductase [Hyphomicrobiales bacterium]|nr:FAD-dependent oxidoreductase [Hyphomicrobiales bacterium]
MKQTIQRNPDSGSIANEAASALYVPKTLLGVEIRNRWVFQPHFTALGSWDGLPTDKMAAYHKARAKGGCGLIIFESVAVHPTGKVSRRQVDCWDPKVIQPFTRVTDAVHEHGGKIFCQLNHCGHSSAEHPPPIMWAPTQMPEPSSNFTTMAMDLDDIAEIVRGFAISARNAVEAGFDGIEVKIGHDGLLRAFASPYFNRRTDGYGGNLANNMRISDEVLEAVRAEVGDNIPIGVRHCVNEFTSFGYFEDYGLEMARHLEARGIVDYFNSDAGSYSSLWMEIPPAGVAPEDLHKINVMLKEATELPVIAFGRVNPGTAANLVTSGEADFIGMARQLIADPETPNKIRDGQGHLIRYCLACNDACLFQMMQEKDIRCVQNPAAGRELQVDEFNLPPAAIERKVVVVGGGPAGMKYAEIATRRGHDVTLIEQERTLGGQVKLAEVQPEHGPIGEVASYLEAVLDDLDVDIRRNTVADSDLVASLSPDCVIVATGSEPNLPSGGGDGARSRELGRQITPELPGLDLPLVTGVDEILSGQRELTGKVVLIDANGHWEAAGTAEFLADAGCEVHVVTPAFHILGDVEAGNRHLSLRRAALKGIHFHTTTTVQAIEEDRVQVAPVFSSTDGEGWGKYVMLPADGTWIEGVQAVVPVIGRRSREELYLSLKEDVRFSEIQIERIGDCVSARLIQIVIGEAYERALAL